jgi:hypothetical protein
VKLTMRLTLDGLLRALRTKADIAADEKIEEARRQRPPKKTESSDERR